MNLFLYLAVIFIVFNKDFLKTIKLSWNNNASKYSVLFFTLFVIGSLWSIASSHEILEALSTYKKLFLVFLILPYLINPLHNNRMINTFFTSMGVILFFTYLIHLGIINPVNTLLYENINLHISESGGFKTHIITNILFSFAGFLTIHRFFLLKKYIFLALGILFFYHSIFINDGTTGQILSISLLSLLIIQKGKYRAVFILPIVLLSILSYGITNSNTSIYHSINKIYRGIDDHNSGVAVKSVDVRLAMLINGLIITKESPWIGTGAGSINQAHINNLDKLPETFKDRSYTENPHSEYLSISIQLGIIGVLFYLFYIYRLFKLTKILPNDFYKHGAQGLLIMLLMASLGTSILTDSGEGHFIAIFIAILFSSLSHKEKSKNE